MVPVRRHHTNTSANTGTLPKMADLRRSKNAKRPYASVHSVDGKEKDRDKGAINKQCFLLKHTIAAGHLLWSSPLFGKKDPLGCFAQCKNFAQYIHKGL